MIWVLVSNEIQVLNHLSDLWPSGGINQQNL